MPFQGPIHVSPFHDASTVRPAEFEDEDFSASAPNTPAWAGRSSPNKAKTWNRSLSALATGDVSPALTGFVQSVRKSAATLFFSLQLRKVLKCVFSGILSGTAWERGLW